MYGTDDWFNLAPTELGTVDVRGIREPFVTMPNEPESKDPAVLGPRYESALAPLFASFGNR